MMAGTSDEVLDRMRTREVTGVFHSKKALELSVQDLLMAGVDRADIDISASSDELGQRLNYQVIPPADLADLPMAPRQPFTGGDDLIAAQTLAGSVAGCAAAVIVAALLVAWGLSPLLIGILAVLCGLIAAGAAVFRVRRRLLRERYLGLETIAEWNGLVMWVRVRSAEVEAAAQEILVRHGAQAVHIHEIDLPKTPEDLPLHALRPDPWLGDEPLGRP
jgi:hypothetical protein